MCLQCWIVLKSVLGRNRQKNLVDVKTNQPSNVNMINICAIHFNTLSETEPWTKPDVELLLQEILFLR